MQAIYIYMYEVVSRCRLSARTSFFSRRFLVSSVLFANLSLHICGKKFESEMYFHADHGLTLSLPRVISHNFLFQSLTRDISYSMENLAFDSLLR